MKKYIPITIILSIFIVFIAMSHSSTSKDTNEIIINYDNIIDKNIIEELKNNFNNYQGIDFIDVSLNARTIVLNVDRNMNQNKLIKILHKLNIDINDMYIRDLKD